MVEESLKLWTGIITEALGNHSSQSIRQEKKSCSTLECMELTLIALGRISWCVRNIRDPNIPVLYLNFHLNWISIRGEKNSLLKYFLHLIL